jgi:hypothetical protein
MMHHVTVAELCGRRWQLEIDYITKLQSFVASRKDCDLDAKEKLIYVRWKPGDSAPCWRLNAGVPGIFTLRDGNRRDIPYLPAKRWWDLPSSRSRRNGSLLEEGIVHFGSYMGSSCCLFS